MFKSVNLSILQKTIDKYPHAFAVCSVGADLLKQESERVDSLWICLDFNLLLTSRKLSPIAFGLPRWGSVGDLTFVFVGGGLEVWECHSFRRVFRGTIDFARVAVHIQR